MKVDEKLREFARAYAEESVIQIVKTIMTISPTVDDAEKLVQGAKVVRLLSDEVFGALCAGGWMAMQFAGLSPDHIIPEVRHNDSEWDEFLSITRVSRE